MSVFEGLRPLFLSNGGSLVCLECVLWLWDQLVELQGCLLPPVHMITACVAFRRFCSALLKQQQPVTLALLPPSFLFPWGANRHPFWPDSEILVPFEGLQFGGFCFSFSFFGGQALSFDAPSLLWETTPSLLVRFVGFVHPQYTPNTSQGSQNPS